MASLMGNSRRSKERSRVLLVQPPVLREPRDGDRSPLVEEFWDAVGLFGQQKGDIDREPNHGLLQIAAVLRQDGWNVGLLELNAKDLASRHSGLAGLAWADIEALLAKEEFQYIGISCLTPNYYRALRIAQLAKRINPEVFVFFGGFFPTFHNRQVLLDSEDVDVVVLGEGVQTVTELLNAVSQQQSLDQIQGIVCRADGRIITTPARPPIQDLDALPIPSYDLLPPESEPIVFRLMLQRGCRYKCKFCSPRQFYGPVRSRDPIKAADQIMYAISKWPSCEVLLGDLCFFQNQEGKYEALCQELIRRKMPKNWWCQTRIDLVTEERAKLLAEAGCTSVGLGVEAGSQKVRDIIDKENSVTLTEKACRLLSKEGISVQAYIMVGLPGETIEDVLSTVQLVTDLISRGLVDTTNISVLVPYPGLPMFTEPQAHGIEIVDYDFSNYYMCVTRFMNPLPVYRTEYLSKYQIRALWELVLASAAEAHRKRRLA